MPDNNSLGPMGLGFEPELTELEIEALGLDTELKIESEALKLDAEIWQLEKDYYW